MLDSKQREAELLRARERLARAFTRFDAIIRVIPERIRSLESSHGKSQARILELEELLGRERAITSQRQSLSESVTEEVQALNLKLEKAEKQIAERDMKIVELDTTLTGKNAELQLSEREHDTFLDREQHFIAQAARLEEDNSALERKLELLKAECNNLQDELLLIASKDNSFALMFTQDERLSLLKTVDSLIERVDTIAGHHSISTK